jgi:hypothetical protein
VRQEAPWKAKSFMLHYIHAVIQLFLHRCAEYNIHLSPLTPHMVPPNLHTDPFALLVFLSLCLLFPGGGLTSVPAFVSRFVGGEAPSECAGLTSVLRFTGGVASPGSMVLKPRVAPKGAVSVGGAGEGATMPSCSWSLRYWNSGSRGLRGGEDG